MHHADFLTMLLALTPQAFLSFALTLPKATEVMERLELWARLLASGLAVKPQACSMLISMQDSSR